jgi:hypothetical protein
MPREVAEYQLRLMEQQVRDQRPWILREFADVPTLDSLARLPVEEMGARWVHAKDRRWAYRELLRETVASGRCPGLDVERVLASIPGAMSPPESRILGTVVADSTAYVLHETPRTRGGTRVRFVRSLVAAMHAPGPDILRLRLAAEGWRVVPTDDVAGAEGQGVGYSCDADLAPAAPSRRDSTTTTSPRKPPT